MEITNPKTIYPRINPHKKEEKKRRTGSSLNRPGGKEVGLDGDVLRFIRVLDRRRRQAEATRVLKSRTQFVAVEVGGPSRNHGKRPGQDWVSEDREACWSWRGWKRTRRDDREEAGLKGWTSDAGEEMRGGSPSPPHSRIRKRTRQKKWCLPPSCTCRGWFLFGSRLLLFYVWLTGSVRTCSSDVDTE